jgi:NitT/TauT family transport system ATP-binding protein
MITIEDLSKSFHHNGQTVAVFRHLNVRIRQGEFLVLFGPNGCGKTTLLNILGGIESQDEGTVIIEGKRAEEVRVGCVFQNYNDSLFPWYTVKNNIRLVLEARGIHSLQERETLIETSLKEVGLHSFSNKYPYQLSGGMKQLLAVVRAFAYEPDFFLMDEPFSALDYENRIKMEDKLLELWSKQKKTVVFVSHDIEEAVYLADRIAVLSKIPASVRHIFDVSLQRPRTMKTRFSKEFSGIKNRVLRSFQGEL